MCAVCVRVCCCDYWAEPRFARIQPVNFEDFRRLICQPITHCSFSVLLPNSSLSPYVPLLSPCLIKSAGSNAYFTLHLYTCICFNSRCSQCFLVESVESSFLLAKFPWFRIRNSCWLILNQHLGKGPRKILFCEIEYLEISWISPSDGYWRWFAP